MYLTFPPVDNHAIYVLYISLLCMISLVFLYKNSTSNYLFKPSFLFIPHNQISFLPSQRRYCHWPMNGNIAEAPDLDAIVGCTERLRHILQNESAIVLISSSFRVYHTDELSPIYVLIFSPTVDTQLVWIASSTHLCSSPCMVGEESQTLFLKGSIPLNRGSPKYFSLSIVLCSSVCYFFKSLI